jgi:hypothetical protein
LAKTLLHKPFKNLKIKNPAYCQFWQNVQKALDNVEVGDKIKVTIALNADV